VHPCVQKTTQLSATRRLAAALRPRFVPLRCTLPNAQHSRVPGGPASDGKFASEALSRYSKRMNQLIAEAIIECIASGKSEPGGAMPSRAALGQAPPANAAKPSAPSNPTASPAPRLADRELQIFHDAGYTISSCIRQTTFSGAT
jgi:hypothetical protein